MARIWIVEDDKVIRQELTSCLRRFGYEAVAMEEFQDPVGQILRGEPDLVLLDVNLPGMNGLAICDGIRRKSQVPIIFVTANDTSMDELTCMMRGGDDYVSKPYQMPVLLARIAAVLKRTMGAGKSEVTQRKYKGVTLDIAAGTISRAGDKCDLTRNELKILYCLFEHAGEIVSRAELIDYLWENEVFIDDNSLSVNVTRVREKLERIGVADFIETRRGLGYQI